MNPRALSSTVPASALLPGDRIAHPATGEPVRVAAVLRSGEGVVAALRGATPISVGRSFRISLLA